jgi:hypothetical protein
MHDAAMWPIHGQYQCRTCGRRYAVPWAEIKPLPVAAKLIAIAPRPSTRSIPAIRLGAGSPLRRPNAEHNADGASRESSIARLWGWLHSTCLVRARINLLKSARSQGPTKQTSAATASMDISTMSAVRSGTNS